MCESETKEVAGCMGMELVGLHVKDLFTGESFTISRNWLTLGGAVSPKSARAWMSNYQNKENKKTYLTPLSSHSSIGSN